MNDTQRSPNGADELTEETVFSVLSSSRRREMLRYLELADGEANLPELTAYLAEVEGRDVSARDELKPVYVSLIQHHVPHLETAGVVTYDREHRLVRLTERADAVLRHLHVSEAPRRSTIFSRWLR